jgi:hypothetical protein
MDASAPTMLRIRPFGHRPTLDELLGRLDPAGLDDVERAYLEIRKGFKAPLTVRDSEEFETIAFDFYAHVYKSLWHVDIKARPEPKRGEWALIGWPSFFKSLGGNWHAYNASIKHGMAGVEGGMIRIINTWTAAMIRDAIDAHIDIIFNAHFPYSDRTAWERIGRELLDRYGKLLRPEDEFIVYLYFYDQVEKLVRTVAITLREIRNTLGRNAPPGKNQP